MIEKKLHLEIKNQRDSESLSDLFDIIKTENAKELYLVGGCVRDMLLGKDPKDYDLCTNALPEEIESIIRSNEKSNYRYHIIETGLKHGTITLHDTKYGTSYEMTTYRADGVYLDNRRPESVSFVTSLEEDLKRRDFTINSFAYDLKTDTLYMLEDSYLKDLEFKIIKTVGNPEERFKEDALRMLRAIRFAAQLNFSIDVETFNAIKACANLLQYISYERIRDELTKILLSDNPQMLEFVSETRLEKVYMQDDPTYIQNMIDCDHQNPYHYTDVFHHTVDVIKNVPKTFEMRWAAFFHDIGKPNVKALKPGTIDHYRFIGHPEESAKIADKMMEMFKFSNNQKDLIHKYVLYHDFPLSSCSDKKFKRMIVEIGEDHFLDFILLRQADALAHKLSESICFAIDAISECKKRFMNYITKREPLRIKDLAINGDDLKERGLVGKEIGDTLKKFLDLVLENPQLNTRDKLLSLISTEGSKTK